MCEWRDARVRLVPIALAGGLRFVCRSPATRRTIGRSARFLHAAHPVVPAAIQVAVL